VGKAFCLQLGGSYNEAEPVGAPSETDVQRDQAAAEQLGEGDVLSIVGAAPTKFLGKLPGFHAQFGWIDSINRAVLEPVVDDLAVISPDLALRELEMQACSRLGSHQRHAGKFFAEHREAVSTSAARRSGDVGVDDEH
jgi:hypothetical protein